MRGFPPPLGLASIAAYLEREGWPVRIIDAYASRLSPEAFGRLLASLPPPAWLGISTVTPLAPTSYALARLAQSIHPATPIVFGGPHPSILPEEVFDRSPARIVVRGEGEITLAELVRGDPVEGIAGLSYRKDDRTVHNPDRGFIPVLDALPRPAYHLLPMGRYRPAQGAFRRLPASSMLLSRGCPFNCSFCGASLLGKKLRWKSIAVAISEIEYLVHAHQIREIAFYDDTFTFRRDYVDSLCTALVRGRLDLTWSCFSRADSVDGAMLRVMKEAGCHQLMFGLESADEEILDNLNKKLSLRQLEEAVRLCKKVGIDTRLAFMFGSPGETERSMRRTAQFVLRLDPDLIIVNVTTPYPGTALYDWARTQGILKTADWSSYDLSRCVMELPTVSTAAVERNYRRMYRRFYLRPTYLLRYLRKIRSTAELLSGLRTLAALLGMRGS